MAALNNEEYVILTDVNPIIGQTPPEPLLCTLLRQLAVLLHVPHTLLTFSGLTDVEFASTKPPTVLAAVAVLPVEAAMAEAVVADTAAAVAATADNKEVCNEVPDRDCNRSLFFTGYGGGRGMQHARDML
jgi:hypothetical protein